MLGFNEFELQGNVAVISVAFKGVRLQVLLDAADLEAVRQKGRLSVVKNGNTFYARFTSHKDKMYLHQFISGDVGAGMLSDHKNHDGLDNRRSNIVVRDKSGNGLNRKGPQSNNKSGARGVFWKPRNRKWGAKVQHKGKAINLGYFKNKSDAEAAVNLKVSQLLMAELP